jgi:hypothetical protein
MYSSLYFAIDVMSGMFVRNALLDCLLLVDLPMSNQNAISGERGLAAEGFLPRDAKRQVTPKLGLFG